MDVLQPTPHHHLYGALCGNAGLRADYSSPAFGHIDWGRLWFWEGRGIGHADAKTINKKERERQRERQREQTNEEEVVEGVNKGTNEYTYSQKRLSRVYMKVYMSLAVSDDAVKKIERPKYPGTVLHYRVFTAAITTAPCSN
jgi:hypothetical protein